MEHIAAMTKGLTICIKLSRSFVSQGKLGPLSSAAIVRQWRLLLMERQESKRMRLPRPTVGRLDHLKVGDRCVGGATGPAGVVGTLRGRRRVCVPMSLTEIRRAPWPVACCPCIRLLSPACRELLHAPEPCRPDPSSRSRRLFRSFPAAQQSAGPGFGDERLPEKLPCPGSPDP